MSTAFLFPGQGSQKVGMGKSLYENFPEAKEVFDEASDALGFSISEICFNGPEEKLKLTEFTQPAILTHSIATLRIIENRTDICADIVAGHSLGEYSALVSAKSLEFSDAVKMVNLRGKAMQVENPEKISMAAILRLNSTQVVSLCNQVNESSSKEHSVWPANFNAPEQTVISGSKEGVDKFTELMKSQEETKKGKASILAVSAPFHCPMMGEATRKMSSVIDKAMVLENTLPYIANITGKTYEMGTSSEIIKKNLVDQIEAPVQWVSTMENLLSQGVSKTYEIGPGNVLTNLIKRFAKSQEKEMGFFTRSEKSDFEN